MKGGEQLMAEDNQTTKPEVIAVALPAGDYGCQGDQKFLRGFVRPVRGFGYKYEYRMAVPNGATIEELDEDCKRLFGDHGDLNFVIRCGVLNLATKADNKAKLELGLDKNFDHEDYDEAKHVAMQIAFEAWRPGVRERKAVTVEEQAGDLIEKEGGLQATLQALREKGLDIPTDAELGLE
jgi:hypothetical protein